MSSNLRHWDCEHTDLLSCAVPGTQVAHSLDKCVCSLGNRVHYGSLISVGNPKLWERIMVLVSLGTVATRGRSDKWGWITFTRIRT